MDQQTPISARASASDPSIATQGPIPLFDTQLRFLADSYISFFQERKRIEETYIDSLKKLHRKSKSIDAFLDDKELSTTRSAWAEVRDTIEREAQARHAFCATLTTDIINPLTAVKETQERTRKRIKEDLKDSTNAYNEYAEGMLPKLKSRYSKRFGDVEEQKRAAAGPPAPIQQPTPEQVASAFVKNNGSSTNRPTVTSPQPLRALDRRPSVSGVSQRARSPSSSIAFSDLAHQGKKQFNQLIGLLDKGSAVKDSLGGRENQALRVVRAKRDADEADKEYRKGVHWLETLRLRRTKILESGFTSLEMFVGESAVVIKNTLERYTDNMIATYTTQTQLAKHARSIVDKIAPEKDVARLVATTPRSLASAIPDPILYEHGQVGSCNDLIFGFSLLDYATAKGLRDGEIPKIVRTCIAEIDKRGLDSEGIYRVSGRHAVVQSLQHEIERDEASFEFNSKDDVYAVASLLKLYLRELPEPLFRYPSQDRIQHSENIAEHQANKFMLLRAKMRRLPAVHQATLRALVEHLARVISHYERNKMDAKNLAIVFGSVIFGEDELPKVAGDLLSVQSSKDTLFEDLILNASIIFDDHPIPHSPPLPPTPIGEAALEVSYGSKTTKVASVPAGSFIPGSPQDFTPRLPPRPASSIHPSSRAYPISPKRPRVELSSATNEEIPSQLLRSSPTPPSPSVASSACETDESLLYREADTSAEKESVKDLSRTSIRRSPPSSLKMTLPPTPTETELPTVPPSEVPSQFDK